MRGSGLRGSGVQRDGRFVGPVVLGMTVVAFVWAVRHALDVEIGRTSTVTAPAAVSRILIVADCGLISGRSWVDLGLISA